MINQPIPRYPIVDTGPLFDFLLWRFSESSRIPNLFSKLIYLTNDPYKKSVQWYFAVAKPITTCPQVIAEIHRHAEKQLRGVYLRNFWVFAQKELIELGLNEELVKLVEMDSDTLSSFGPADTALLRIATDLNRPVFTAEGKLAGLCRKKEVSVLGIADILSIWQQYGSK